jgi:hypothetical protein
VDKTFTLPGTTGPQIMVHRPALGTIRVLIDGVPAVRRKGRTLTYDVPLADGSTTDLTLKGQWTGLRAVANGVVMPLEPTVPGYALVVMFLPLVLVIGGILGALVGLGGAAINARLVRGRASGAVKVLAMLGVTVVAIVVYFGVALGVGFAVAPIPTLQAGTCVNGIKAGVSVTGDIARPVDCANPHDNEVIGSTVYAPDGAFPGQDALKSFADTACAEAFEPYVGVAFDPSSLDMIAVTPSELTWAKGDRQVSCVVVAGNGGQLTGSVKGTGQ